MANLRVHSKDGNYDEELKKQIRGDIQSVKSQIRELNAKHKELKLQLLEVEIKPFKIGGYALVEVPCGKSKKEQKCLLECENGELYVRPLKENGELSGRHFSVFPINKKYTDFLKEVK